MATNANKQPDVDNSAHGHAKTIFYQSCRCSAGHFFRTAQKYTFPKFPRRLRPANHSTHDAAAMESVFNYVFFPLNLTTSHWQRPVAEAGNALLILRLMQPPCAYKDGSIPEFQPHCFALFCFVLSSLVLGCCVLFRFHWV